MSENTFNITKEDIRKSESEVSKKNQGNVPADSEPSLTKVGFPTNFHLYRLLTNLLKSFVDENSKNKKDLIEERRSNLPLPDDPPTTSDFNSSDISTVNVGSGGIESDISYGGGGDSLRGPATSESGVRTQGEAFNKNSDAPGTIGRQAAEGLEGLPKDATLR